MKVSCLQETLVPRIDLPKKPHELLLTKPTPKPQQFLKIPSLTVLGNNITIINRLIRVHKPQQIRMLNFPHTFQLNLQQILLDLIIQWF